MSAFLRSVIGVRRCYPGKGGKSTKSQRRILILFPGSLGDFLCFLPALQFMHAANPGCQLEVAVRGDGLALARRLSEVARTLSLESRTFAKLFSLQSSFTPEEERLFISVDEIISWFGHTRPEVNTALRQIGAQNIHSFPFFSGQDDLPAPAYSPRWLARASPPSPPPAPSFLPC